MTIFDEAGDSGMSRSQAAAASNDAANARRDAAAVGDDVARLRLVCAALWELVKEKTHLTEDDLITKMAILDAKDGVADGKLTRGTRACAFCGRNVAGKTMKCMYCGKTQPATSVFEGL